MLGRQQVKAREIEENNKREQERLLEEAEAADKAAAEAAEE